MTTGSTTGRKPRGRTWYVVIAAAWALLGALALSDGRTWLGVATLVLAAVQLAAGFSPRLASWGEAPLVRRPR